MGADIEMSLGRREPVEAPPAPKAGRHRMYWSEQRKAVVYERSDADGNWKEIGEDEFRGRATDA